MILHPGFCFSVRSMFSRFLADQKLRAIYDHFQEPLSMIVMLSALIGIACLIVAAAQGSLGDPNGSHFAFLAAGVVATACFPSANSPVFAGIDSVQYDF